MNEREKYLLKEAYKAGFDNALLMVADNANLAGSLSQESERWVEEVIADNGVTVGQYICHRAPENALELDNKKLREALEKYIRAGCQTGTHYVNQKAALDNAMKLLNA